MCYTLLVFYEMTFILPEELKSDQQSAKCYRLSWARRGRLSFPYRQDLPPPGGFEAIKYKRSLPFRGPGGWAILGGVTLFCGIGFYRLGQGNLERRELKREKAWSRLHLVPMLLAEGDRDAYRREQAALAREKEIMKDVKGWENAVERTKHGEEDVRDVHEEDPISKRKKSFLAHLQYIPPISSYYPYSEAIGAYLKI
ncbi:hypothetical protein FRC02_012012 [Tulasnella sp. 418]|nr:hypothetical protein FRC02_012012 [Tulasnella sp. 418]